MELSRRYTDYDEYFNEAGEAVPLFRLFDKYCEYQVRELVEMESFDLSKERIRLHFKCFFREWIARLPYVVGRNPAPNKVKSREMNDLMLILLHKIENSVSTNICPYGYDVVVCMEDYAMKVWVENRPYADVMVIFYEKRRQPHKHSAVFTYATSDIQFNGAVREKLREMIYPLYKEGAYRESKFEVSGWRPINPNNTNPDLIKRMIACHELSLL